MIVLPLQKGSNAERSKHRNRQAVLGQVRTAGTIGRAEIARALSLTTQTVSNIIAELSQDGMLLEKGRLSAGRGLPAIQYALNPEGGYALGIEVRPDAILAALLDMKGKAVTTERVAINETQPDVVLSHVKALFARALDQVPTAQGRVLGAGVVMLESLTLARRRRAEILAEIVGVGVGVGCAVPIVTAVMAILGSLALIAMSHT